MAAKSSLLPSSLNLHRLVNKIMAYTNSYTKFLSITTCWIPASLAQDMEKAIIAPSISTSLRTLPFLCQP